MSAREVLAALRPYKQKFDTLGHDQADAIIAALTAAGFEIVERPPSRSDELLRLLRIPTGKNTRNGVVERRQVYRGDKSENWYLTYSGNIPKYVPFARCDVDALRAAGLIERSYPELDECFVATNQRDAEQ